MVASNKLEELLSESSHVPDHNMLCITVELSSIINEGLISGRTLGSKSVRREHILHLYWKKYMESVTALRILPSLMKQLESQMTEQKDIDENYHAVIKLILDEVKKSISNSTRKCKHTKRKEYWT